MKTRIKIIAAMLLFSTYNIRAGEMLNEGPFSGIDISSLSTNEAAIIRKANEDFVLAQKGHKPRYAVVDNEQGLPADGGTTFWKGNGYKLVIFQSLSHFGQLNGYIYGPEIEFDKKFATGNMQVVSSVRFYSHDQLEQLKNNANKGMSTR